MSKKPVLWITRKLSDNTEKRAAQHYDVMLNPADTLSSADDIVEMSKRVDAISRATQNISVQTLLPASIADSKLLPIIL